MTGGRRGRRVSCAGTAGGARRRAGAGEDGLLPGGDWGHTDGGGGWRADQDTGRGGGAGEGSHAPALHRALPLQAGQPWHRAENQF